MHVPSDDGFISERGQFLTNLLLLLDPEGRIQQVNPIFETVTGRASTQAKGRCFWELLIPHEELSAFSRLWDSFISGRDPAVFDFPLMHADGSQRPVLWSMAPLTDEGGRIQNIIVTGMDIADRRAAEDALKESGRRFRLLFGSMFEGCAFCRILFDEKGQPVDFIFLEVNESFKRFTGCKDLLGKKVTEVFPSAIQTNPEIIEAFCRVGLTGKSENLETYFNPLELWLSISMYRLQQNYFVAIFHDITKPKWAQRELIESRNHFRVLTENVASGIALVDENGKFVIVNPTFLSMFDLPETSVIQDVNDQSWDEWKVFDEYGRRLDFSEHPVREALLTRTAVRNQPVAVQSPSTTSLKWMQISAEPILAPDGKLDVLICTYHNITELKRAEQALKESEHKYRALFENMAEEVHFWEIVRDENGRIETWRLADANPPTLKAWGRQSVEELRGKTADEILGPGSTEHFMPVVQTILKTGRPHSFEDYLPLIDRYFRFTTVPWGDCFITTGADITDIKKVQETLAKERDTLEQRVAERTVELEKRASQLRALAGELTLAEQRERSRLAKILHDHIQQLLVAAKYRTAVAGKTDVNQAGDGMKDIEELIDEAIAASRSLTAELFPTILYEAGLSTALQWLAKRMADKQGLQVECSLDESGPLPEHLTVLLFESVRELLFNIAKHAHTQRAWVTLVRNDNFLQVVVADDGVGFDPNSMPAVIEQGRGFGLFSIRERLELIGGKLEISSASNQGTRIILTSFIAQGEAGRTPEMATAADQSRTRQPHALSEDARIRVLLADDHAVVRLGIANLLRDEPDIEIAGEAGDGDEAVHLARVLHPDVILMDMSMPKLNGIEATRIIHGEFPEIVIIGLSMFEEVERAQAMKAAGAVHYLNKSGPAKELIQSLRSCVRTYSSMHSHQI